MLSMTSGLSGTGESLCLWVSLSFMLRLSQFIRRAKFSFKQILNLDDDLLEFE